MINNIINNLSNKIFLTRKERKRRSDEFWENFKKELGDTNLLDELTVSKIDASKITVDPDFPFLFISKRELEGRMKKMEGK